MTAFRVVQDTTQSLGAGTVLNFQLTRFDPDAGFSTNTFTIPASWNGKVGQLFAGYRTSGTANEPTLNIEQSTDGGTVWTDVAASIGSPLTTSMTTKTAAMEFTTGYKYRVIVYGSSTTTGAASTNFSGCILPTAASTTKYVEGTLSANQSIANSGFDPIEFDGTTFDDDGLLDITTGNIVIPDDAPTMYGIFSGTASFSVYERFGIYCQTSFANPPDFTADSGQFLIEDLGSGESCCGVLLVQPGDQFHVKVFNGSGTTRDITNTYCFISMMMWNDPTGPNLGDVGTYTMPTGVPDPIVWLSPRDVTLSTGDITAFLNQGTGGATYDATRGSAPYCTVETPDSWGAKDIADIPAAASYQINGGTGAPSIKSIASIATYEDGIDATFNDFAGFVGGGTEMIGDNGDNFWFSGLPNDPYVDGQATATVLPCEKRTIGGTDTAGTTTYLFRDDFSATRDWVGKCGDILMWQEELTPVQMNTVHKMLAAYYYADPLAGASNHYDLSLGDYTESAGNITLIPDQIGTADLDTTIASKFPADTRTLNGLAVVDFDSANDEVIYGGGLTMTATDQAYTLSMAVDIDAPTAYYHFASFNSTSGDAYYAHIIDDSPNEWGHIKRDTVSTTSTNTSTSQTPTSGAHILMWVHTGTTVTIYVDNVAVLTAASSDVNLMSNVTIFSLGGWQNGSSVFGPVDGGIGEVVLHKFALDTSEINQMHNYLRDKWIP